MIINRVASVVKQSTINVGRRIPAGWWQDANRTDTERYKVSVTQRCSIEFCRCFLMQISERIISTLAKRYYMI